MNDQSVRLAQLVSHLESKIKALDYRATDGDMDAFTLAAIESRATEYKLWAQAIIDMQEQNDARLAACEKAQQWLNHLADQARFWSDDEQTLSNVLADAVNKTKEQVT